MRMQESRLIKHKTVPPNWQHPNGLIVTFAEQNWSDLEKQKQVSDRDKWRSRFYVHNTQTKNTRPKVHEAGLKERENTRSQSLSRNQHVPSYTLCSHRRSQRIKIPSPLYPPKSILPPCACGSDNHQIDHIFVRQEKDNRDQVCD